MRILELTDRQTSDAAVIEDRRTLAAVNEEQIVRIELARGFPWKAIEEVLRLSNTAAHEIKAVAQMNMESGRQRRHPEKMGRQRHSATPQ